MLARLDRYEQGDTPGGDLLAAIGRHLALVLVPVLVLAALGAAYGLLRDAHYTAETRISIGQLNLSSQGVPGFVSAGSSLASAYARTIDAPAITQAASRATGISVADARDALSGSGIPDSPLFRIEAETTDAKKSVKLVNVASKSLVGYVLQINERSNLRGQVLGKFRRAAESVSRYAVAQRRATNRLNRARNAKNVSRLIRVATRRQIAQLRADSLGRIYAAAAGGELAQNLLQVISPADHADSDRTEMTGQWAGTGALAGLVIGIALAAMSEARLRRRRTATPAV
jgi:uncharacterized protein involved in exopolysaccharide biosynthesis